MKERKQKVPRVRPSRAAYKRMYRAKNRYPCPFKLFFAKSYPERDVYICCDKTFGGRTEAFRHVPVCMKQHIITKAIPHEDAKFFGKEFCRTVPQDCLQAMARFEARHKRGLVGSRSPGRPRLEKYECSPCNKRFKDAKALHGHRNTKRHHKTVADSLPEDEEIFSNE